MVASDCFGVAKALPHHDEVRAREIIFGPGSNQAW